MTDKAFRLLQLHDRLSKGEPIVKDNALAEFGIPPKTFQRDIDSLRQYYTEHVGGELRYDRRHNCYRLLANADKLTKQELFALCKVLIESRGLNKAEFNAIIVKLLQQCDTFEAAAVRAMIANERVNYIPLQHGKPLVAMLWDLAVCVSDQRIIRIPYKRLDGRIRVHCVKPVGIIFSEFYFYLIAYMADGSKEFPTVFRVDRIKSVTRLPETFDVPYAERFNESEFRKRVQFMYSGELRTVRFLFRGSPEAVLDRLPTASVESKTEDGLLIRAEAFGDGIYMWLRSQGDKVEVME
jgi:predicted DNA-binding transcriptional regulator YafY